MAIFDKSDRSTPRDFSSETTIISSGTRLVGKIDTECDLNIEGDVEGEIKSSSTVKVGNSGTVKSNLTAKKLIVSGRFLGTADCDHIELTSGGTAEGKLISSVLVIDSSSSFQGESVRRDKEEGGTKLLEFTAGPFGTTDEKNVVDEKK